jgi:copper transport protein
MNLRPHRARRWLLISVVTVALAFGVPVGAAQGHAFLERSDPAANTVVPEVPIEVRLWFTEPLEPAYSRAELFDAQGRKIATEPSRLGEDRRELVLPLPPELPRGTYTVQWRNVSAADGHPQAGFFSFTVGTLADAQVPAPPPPLPVGFAPRWLEAAGRWLALVGLSGMLGAVACWIWVVYPSIAPLDAGTRSRVARAVRRLALASFSCAALGSLLGLGVQAWNAEGRLSLAAAGSLLSGSRFGLLWMARAVLLVALGAMLASGASWTGPIRARRAAALLALGLAAALAYASVSHAAAQPVGRPAAVAADWLHLVAASVWVGGVATLAAGLVLSRRGETERWREVYARAIPRFSTVAIASVAILALTGLYSAWLQVGNLEALRSTGYGRVLLVKLALVLLLLELGAINLLVIGPRMRRSAEGTRHFGYTVLAEVAIGLAVLLTAGVMTSLPPARDVLAAQAGRTSFHLVDGDVHVSLSISPGSIGFNRYTVDLALAGQDVPPETAVLLRVTPPASLEGMREIALSPHPGASGQQVRYEARGSELSVVGRWELELIVRRPGKEDWRAKLPFEVSERPAVERQPAPPPRFGGWTAAAGVVGLGLAVLLITVGLRRRDPRGTGRFLAELGGGLALVCLVALLVTRESATPGAAARNPVPATPDSIAIGRALFQANCTVCHGPSGRGDGPAAAALDWPRINMDLTAHLDQHPDGDLYWWITKGKAGTPMPGFEGRLTDEEVWHLVNYLRSLAASSTP